VKRGPGGSAMQAWLPQGTRRCGVGIPARPTRACTLRSHAHVSQCAGCCSGSNRAQLGHTRYEASAMGVKCVRVTPPSAACSNTRQGGLVNVS
jgi:hypothetical protein